MGTIEIKQPAVLEATVTVTNETFAGANDGIISVNSITGGTGVFEYSIDGMNYWSTGRFTGQTSGTYDVRIRDANSLSCMISVQKVIQPAGSLSADVSQTTVSCYGSKTGKITISNASGGSGNYEYSVDKGVTWQASGNYTALAAGTYDVMLRDVNLPANKISLGKVNITQPQRLFATYNNYVPPLCAGGSGSIMISARGGIPPYQGTGDFTIPSGVGDVYKQYIVSDKNECTAVIIFMFSNPEKIVANGVESPPLYYGTDGTVTVSATGGTGTLTGVGTYTVQAGKSYSFKVTDSNGCSSNIISGVMPNPENTKIPMTITESITEIDFGIQRMGAIDLQVAGGTESYTYHWSNGAVTKDIHGLKDGGTYTVIVTDSNGCSATKAFTLAIPNYLPVANAGADQIVYEGVTVTLDGSGSTDANQDKLRYIWTAPTGILLSNSTSNKPSFLAPEIERDTILTFTLVVNDGKVNSSPATIKIAIQNVIKVGNTSLLELSSMKIYPNPNNGIIQIEGLPANQRNKIALFASDGRLIKKKSSSSINEMIDISDKPSGLYILNINSQTFKIVKK